MVDGNDADAVYQVATEAIGRADVARDRHLVEAQTYREQGHSRADPAKYLHPPSAGLEGAGPDPRRYHEKIAGASASPGR